LFTEENRPQETLGHVVPFTGKGYPLYADKEKHALPPGTSSFHQGHCLSIGDIIFPPGTLQEPHHLPIKATFPTSPPCSTAKRIPIPHRLHTEERRSSTLRRHRRDVEIAPLQGRTNVMGKCPESHPLNTWEPLPAGTHPLNTKKTHLPNNPTLKLNPNLLHTLPKQLAKSKSSMYS